MSTYLPRAAGLKLDFARLALLAGDDYPDELSKLPRYNSAVALISFARATSTTRINQAGASETVPAGQPRFDFDATTHASLGWYLAADDVAYITQLSPWFVAAKGTLIVDFATAVANACAVAMGNGTDRLSIETTSTQVKARRMVGGSPTDLVQTRPGSGTIRAALTWDAAGFALAVNGSAVLSSALSMPAITRHDLGKLSDGTLPLTGLLKQVLIWPQRVGAGLLQSLST